jgi:hypothetical protein
MNCKGCGGDKEDTYKGKRYCHYCGKETGISGVTMIYQSTGSSGSINYYGSPLSERNGTDLPSHPLGSVIYVHQA